MRKTPMIKIAGREIGPGYPPYIVAEMSGNHNGDINRALAIIEAAKDAGADAVKLQTYTADTLTIDHDSSDFVIKGGLWDGYTLYKLYQEAHTPWDWHQNLFAKGRELGITVFSSPFDASAVSFLEKLDTPAYKISSFEATDPLLIKSAAATGKPVILSTGLSNLSEIESGVNAVRAGGCEDLVLLHCVSGYPTEPKDANLRTMNHLADAFGAVPGLSDHTHGTAVSVAAVALGACFIEKHVTLSRADGGPDAAFSLEPHELCDLVTGCRAAWDALGEVNYARKESEKGNETFRRSLYVVADVAEGEVFTTENVRSIRPGFGLAPKHYSDIIGKQASRSITRGTPLRWDLVRRE